jgi:hypothetical protein
VTGAQKEATMTENEVRGRALGAIILNAVTRWESVLTLLLTAGLVIVQPQPFPWWQPWFWVVGGLAAEAALVISAITDPNAAQAAVAREFEQKFDLRRIKGPVARKRLEDALEYRRNMLTLVERHKGAMKLSLAQTVSDVNDWIAHMYDLALHIDDFEENDLVRRDRTQVPQQISTVRRRLEAESDASVRAELEAQLQRLTQQLDNLRATESSAKRAEIQLESTLTSLGTIYAQMSLLGTKEVDSARAQRLREDIKDEVNSLQDTIEALSEVQSQRLMLR